MFRLDTAGENKNEHFQLQIMNKRRITSAEGELTNKCVAVWGNFQNRLESKLSLCKTAIPDSFFFWKTMMMQGWRMRIMPFLNIWPMEPNFPMCNGLQRKKIHQSMWSVLLLFTFLSNTSPYIQQPYVLQSSLTNFYSSPSSASQTKYSDVIAFCFAWSFSTCQLSTAFFGYFPFISCLSGYQIMKTRHHIKERKILYFKQLAKQFP